jgi:hypothetical protein
MLRIKAVGFNSLCRILELKVSSFAVSVCLKKSPLSLAVLPPRDFLNLIQEKL